MYRVYHFNFKGPFPWIYTIDCEQQVVEFALIVYRNAEGTNIFIIIITFSNEETFYDLIGLWIFFIFNESVIMRFI